MCSTWPLAKHFRALLAPPSELPASCCSPSRPLPLPQVISLEDIEELLGKRPFESTGLRNIDRARKVPLPDPEPEAGQGEAQQAGSEDGPGDASEPALEPPPREPGIAVAT